MAFRFGGKPSTLFPVSANPWSATSVQTNPNYVFFTPAAFPAAQELNFIMGGLSDAALNAITVPALNWDDPISATTIATGIVTNPINTGAHWDPIGTQWLLCISNSSGVGGGQVFYGTYYTGMAFTQVVPGAGVVAASGTLRDAVYDGTTIFTVGVTVGTGTNVYGTAPGAAWGGSLFNNAAAGAADARLSVFSGNVFVFIANGTDTRIAYTVVGGAGASWTTITSFGFGGTGVVSADNGSIQVVFPVAVNPPGYFTNPAGLPGTWSTRSAAFLGASETPVGLAYDAAAGVFILMTQNSISGNPAFYNSSDALAWTKVRTITSVTAPEGLACTPDGIMVMVSKTGGGFGGPLTAATYGMQFSTDDGATWYQNDVITTNVGGFTLNSPTAVAGSTGFLTFNNGRVRISKAVGRGTLVV